MAVSTRSSLLFSLALVVVLSSAGPVLAFNPREGSTDGGSGWIMAIQSGMPMEAGSSGSAFHFRLESPPLGQNDNIRVHRPSVHLHLMHSGAYARNASSDFGMTSILIGVSRPLHDVDETSRVIASAQARIGAVQFRRDFGFITTAPTVYPSISDNARSEWAAALLLGLRTHFRIDDNIRLNVEINGGFQRVISVNGEAQLEMDLYKGFAATVTGHYGRMIESGTYDAIDEGSVFADGGGLSWSYLFAGLSYRY